MRLLVPALNKVLNIEALNRWQPQAEKQACIQHTFLKDCQKYMIPTKREANVSQIVGFVEK